MKRFHGEAVAMNEEFWFVTLVLLTITIAVNIALTE